MVPPTHAVDHPGTARCPEPLCLQVRVTHFRVVSPTTSKGATPSSSLLRAHAPDPTPFTKTSCATLIFSGLRRLLPAPAGRWPFPAFSLRHLSPHAWTYIPVLPLVHLPVSSQETSACTTSGSARCNAQQSVPATSGRGDIAGLSVMLSCAGLRVCSPPRSLLPQWLPLGSRGFYVRAYYGLFPPRTCGYALRPNRAIDGVGTCTPQDSRPCRPLPRGRRPRAPLRRYPRPCRDACPDRATPGCGPLRRGCHSALGAPQASGARRGRRWGALRERGRGDGAKRAFILPIRPGQSGRPKGQVDEHQAHNASSAVQ